MMSADIAMNIYVNERRSIGACNVQRTTIWRCGASLIAIVVLAALVDVPATDWVHRHPPSPAIKPLLHMLRLPGYYGFTAAVAGLIVWPFHRRWQDAVALLAGGALASGVTAVLKYCCGRIRPFHDQAAFDWKPFPCSIREAFHFNNLSFPSGDSTLAFATAIVIALAFPKLRRVAFAWAILVAIARVLQGAHYPSDVAAGAIVGISFGALVYHVLEPKELGPRHRIDLMTNE